MTEASLKILESVIVSKEMGGMVEFMKTGIYPVCLVLRSSLLKKTWRHKVRSEKQFGTIRSNGLPLFHYKLTKKLFRLQYVNPDGTVSKWVTKDMILVLFD
jgi:hypothetical protein